MSNYPYSFDNTITLPGVSGTSQEDMAITALRSAVFAIETELGITPSGIYPDVRTRLDILESRINMSISPGFPADGYVKSPFYIWNVPQSIMLSISDGYGAPTENRLDGSLYMRGGDGYANNQLYVRLNGQWYPVQTEKFTAAKDLAPYLSVPGNEDGHLAQTVVGLYNHPFNTAMNIMNAVQDGYHVTWNNTSGVWESQTGFIPTHDLTAFSGPYGRTGQTVTGIQGFHVSPATPTDGQMFVWSATNSAWEPRVRPIVFTNSVIAGDGYVVRTNIASNKGSTQSPNISAASKVGMVNFGSRSTGSTTGVTDSYGTILGGDRLQVSGIYGIAVGGDSNTVSTPYGAIIGGLNNIVSGQYAAVLDGYSDTASGANSFVLNGGNNTAAALFSGILNGISNTIAVGAAHAGIGWGQLNAISAGGISSVILGGSGNSATAPNVFIGNPTGGSAAATYASIHSGLTHSIAAGSTYATIINGATHVINASSVSALIGNGNNITLTGNYATALNANTATLNGLHSLVLNGASHNITASYSTIINGLTNTISGGSATAYATIVDGYSQSISGAGSFIGDGYSNSISGQWSSILNGNANTIAGKNSTILNGGTNLIDVSTADTTILAGAFNQIIGSTNAVVSGSSNIVTGSNNTYVLGSLNTVSSTASKIIGSNNIIGAGGTSNRVFGSTNTLGSSPVMNTIFGNANNVGPSATTHDNNIFGSNNVVDGFGSSTVAGQSNVAAANFADVAGQYGKARLFGQEVRANGRFTGTTVTGASIGQTLPQATITVFSTVNFPASGTVAINTSTGLQTVTYSATTPTSLTGCAGGTGVMSATSGVGKIGEVQWSRLLLDGYSTSVGGIVPLQLQDTILANPTFVDGYSYDMTIKILVVNTSPISPNPVVPARFYLDVLAHQESGVLVIDNVNESLSTPNTVDSITRTPWTVSVTASGNQMVLQVDTEIPSSYVQPTNSPSIRRAMATIDMREISRI